MKQGFQMEEVKRRFQIEDVKRGFQILAAATIFLALGVAAKAQRAPHVEIGPEAHGKLKVHRHATVDANPPADDQDCSLGDLTQEVTCVNGDVTVDILLAPNDAARFYPSLDMNCYSPPGTYPSKPCKFDVLGEALASLPSGAFKKYCGVENLRGLPPTPGAFRIDGVPCDDWNAKNKSITEEMCRPEDLGTGGDYYPPPCHKRKSANGDSETDSTSLVTHCEDRATGQRVNCITSPTGNLNALIPVTYRIVTVRTPHGAAQCFVRLEDGQGHVGLYGIDEQQKYTQKADTVLK